MQETKQSRPGPTRARRCFYKHNWKKFLNLVCFKDYVNNCVKQLATDACYYDETIAAFNSFRCSLHDAVYI